MPPGATDTLVQVTPHGLYVPSADLYLDARWAPGIVFVSHAHADHCTRADHIVCTPETAAPRCDVLVMECTFGEPRYVFPPDDALLSQLYQFIEAAFVDGATPIVLAYPLGKGQEALHHLTSHGFDVVVHGAIATMCRVHVQLGHPFPGPGIWTLYRRGEVGRRVLLTTPSTRNTAMVQGIGRRRIVHLTGWAYHPGAHNIYKGCDLVLPLSDHADYSELVGTARESGARRIYTVHGPDRFAERLRALGLSAEHLAAHPQDFSDDDEGAPTQSSRTPDQHTLNLQ